LFYRDAPAAAADVLAGLVATLFELFATRTVDSPANDTWVFPVRKVTSIDTTKEAVDALGRVSHGDDLRAGGSRLSPLDAVLHG
jgi:hypothetical protein